jgi:hypothetical protein
MGETLYKVLSKDGRSIHGGDLQWSLPTQKPDGSWEPGDWHQVDGDLVPCHNGLHLTDERGVWRDWIVWGSVVWEAEAGRERVGALSDGESRKVAVRRARLVRPMTEPDWWVAAKRFVAQDIPAVPWFRPDGEPDPAWRLSTAETWGAARTAARGAARGAAQGAAGTAAAGTAARTAAWDAARDAARDAAGTAARTAARDAAWDAAGAAAGTAACDAARDAAWDAAGAAAADAALVATMAVAPDAGVAPEHRAHAAARWNVWRKGYALLCDVDGVLYVYAKEET